MRRESARSCGRRFLARALERRFGGDWRPVLWSPATGDAGDALPGQLDRVFGGQDVNAVGGVAPAGAEDLEAESRRALDGAIEGAFAGAPPVRVIRAVEEGEPAPTLVRRSEDAALLVVGSRGHGAFVGMLIGSVSEYCVTHADCPVVVLRGPEG
jgi:nucleotide-binding universal stress UspA family protein